MKYLFVSLITIIFATSSYAFDCKKIATYFSSSKIKIKRQSLLSLLNFKRKKFNDNFYRNEKARITKLKNLNTISPHNLTRNEQVMAYMEVLMEREYGKKKIAFVETKLKKWSQSIRLKKIKRPSDIKKLASSLYLALYGGDLLWYKKLSLDKKELADHFFFKMATLHSFENTLHKNLYFNVDLKNNSLFHRIGIFLKGPSMQIVLTAFFNALSFDQGYGLSYIPYFTGHFTDRIMPYILQKNFKKARQLFAKELSSKGRHALIRYQNSYPIFATGLMAYLIYEGYLEYQLNKEQTSQEETQKIIAEKLTPTGDEHRILNTPRDARYLEILKEKFKSLNQRPPTKEEIEYLKENICSNLKIKYSHNIAPEMSFCSLQGPQIQ